MMVRSNGVARLIWLGLILVTVSVAGCATNSGQGELNFGIPPALEANRPMWPPRQDGEVPRYMYAGQLTGEENFREPPQPRTKTQAFFHWLLGLFDDEAVPVVLQRPQSGVVDEAGRILVTDGSRQAVYVFDPQEKRLDVWENADRTTHFAAPSGIALGGSGEVYVADAELGLVAKLKRNGEPIAIIGMGELRRPVGVAFDSVSRHLYVADTYAHDIKVFEENGRLLRTLGQRGVNPGEFNFPTYLTWAKGELYVTDTVNARVQVLNADTGQARLTIGEMGMNLGNLVRPKGVAVDDEGNVYVVESYYDRLLVFNKRGEFLMPIGGTGQGIGQFFLPSGVWSDVHNRIFVADMFNGRVALFQFLGGGAEGE